MSQKTRLELMLMRGSRTLIDLLVLSAAFWGAFLLRFEGAPDLWHLKLAAFTWPYVVGFQLLLMRVFGTSRFTWRHVGLRETLRIGLALTSSTIVLLVLRLALVRVPGYASYVRLPLGVIGIDLLLAFLGVVGVRAVRRMTVERGDRASYKSRSWQARRTLLIGAGKAGLIVSREIESRPDMGIEPVGFLDDNLALEGRFVHGLEVLGTTQDIVRIADELEVQNALITIARASGKEIFRIHEACRQAGLKTQIVPGLYEIVGGHVNLSAIRDIQIEDLLGREKIELDNNAISGFIRGHSVMVTGAGGSIGSELCRQIARYDPSGLVLVEQAENALYEIHRELTASPSGFGVIPCLADICDPDRMEWIFQHYSPTIVFHAAAHKHVPMMEWNASEAVKNNILGSKAMADLSDRHGVENFVMISTDKAVNPTSVMGATKRMAEIYIQALSGRSDTCFNAVRFGNVLGSAGSVIPLFKEQIANGGPITVTHPDMKRYFMTIPEASQLVLQAGSIGTDGQVMILDMGEPVKITDLATDLIRLSGLTPGEDIEIVFSGIRPGEKLYEQLAWDHENADKTKHPKIFVGQIQSQGWESADRVLAALTLAVLQGDSDLVREKLGEAIPEYQGPEHIPGVPIHLGEAVL